MYIELMTPQNRSGRSSMSCGPGVTPTTSSAAKSIAIEALAGMPIVSSGMKDEVAAALLADSGPATPSIAPRPKREGSFATRFSAAYAARLAITAPPPGSTPRKKPMTEPRPIAGAACLRSLRDGQMLAIAAGTCGFPCRSSRL